MTILWQEVARRQIVAIATVLAVALPAAALDSNRPLREFPRRTWGLSNGLPQTSVNSLAQTPDGYIWVGTQEGLARFDGVRFTIFNVSNAPTLPSDWILTLLSDRAGTLWIGTAKGIAKYKDGQIVADPRLAGQRVFWLAEDRRTGTIWVGAKEGLYWLNGDRELRRADGRVEGFVRSISVGADSVWVGTSRGLYRFRNGRMVEIPPGLPKEAPVYGVSENAKGDVWVGTRDRLWSLHKGRFEEVHERALMETEIWRAATDRAGTTWLGTRTGLVRMGKSGVETLTIADGLPDHFIVAILEDREGSLWVGTYLGGLIQLYDGPFTLHTEREGLPRATVWSIQGRGDEVWAAAESGPIARFRAGRWQQLPLIDKDATVIYLDRRSDLWIGAGSNLARVRGERVTWYGAAQGLLNGQIHSLLEANDGSLWVGTDGGIARLDRERRVAATFEGQSIQHDVLGLVEDRQGRMWIGTITGALLWDGKVLRRSVGGSALTQSAIVSFQIDTAGDVWFSSIEGLYRVRNDHLTQYTERDFKNATRIGKVHDDGAGGLWFVTDRGLIFARRRDIDAISSGKPLRNMMTFGSADGMGDHELAWGGSPSAWASPDGRLWLPSSRGVVVFDPSRARENAIVTPLIQQVVVDGRRIAATGRIRLARDARRIELAFTAPSFIAPHRLRFRYQLVNFDRGWIDAAGDRAARYTNLPQGRFRFRLQAATLDGNWVEAPAAFELDVPVPVYMHPAFIIFAMAAILSLMFAVHQLRVRRIEQRYALMLSERTRIAREFHDTLAQGLTGAHLKIETAAKALPDGDRARDLLDSAGKLVRWSLAETRRAVIDLRSELLEEHDLVSAIRIAGEKMTAGLRMTAKVSVAGVARRLQPEVENHLLRISQEGIANSVKHSDATTIDVLLEFRSASVMLRITDDGSLANDLPAAARVRAGDFGIRGIRERVSEMGGTLTIHSESGMGIVVEVAG